MKSKVVIFGAWQEGINLFYEIQNKFDIVAFLDNNQALQSKEVYGIKIMSPYDLKKIDYDMIFISSSKQYHQMRIQLLELGISNTRIKILFNKNKISSDLRMYDNFFKGKIDYYEKKWEEIQKKYNRVSICMLDVSGIGEMIIRLCIMIDDQANIEESHLRVYVPSIGKGKRICNKEVVMLAQNRLNIVDNKNIGFWKYILDMHGNELDFYDYNKYLFRGEMVNRVIQTSYVFAKFRQSQIEFGKINMKRMGIKGEYVCVAARSSAYAKSSMKDINLMNLNISAHEYRNSDFDEYRETIYYLKTLSLQTVRMGRGENSIEPIDNCIDYAGLYADDFMDIFLMANCKFVIVGGGSGIYTLSTVYGRPVLFVNTTLITLGNGGEYYTELDMYIPKKMFSREEGRYLSLMEMADVENHCLANGIMYKNNGIEFIDNSATEILDATKEMLARMNNQWKDNEENVRLNKRYKEIMILVNEKSTNNIYNWIGGIMPRRLATSYLKENLYLLNAKKSQSCII